MKAIWQQQWPREDIECDVVAYVSYRGEVCAVIKLSDGELRAIRLCFVRAR